jgi:ribosome-associated heat shock protein Hsp15
MENEIRLDKWLWTMRLFKTRSLAADYCKKGKVLLHNMPVKASHLVKPGDVVQIKRSPVIFSFQIKAISKNRLNAKLVPEYMANVTPQDQLNLLEIEKINGFVDRSRGLGRPTKKERRALDAFRNDTEEEFWNFDDED